MTGCGACKFLRRKCVKGCVFASYFCHEQGATHFAAIHKVFGASNVSKLLAHLPVSDRGEAAVTISYEAQARLQDPIYGCVSHIFALQQQVVNLQAQLASLKEQAAQGINLNYGSVSTANPNNGKYYYGKQLPHQDDVQTNWFHPDNSSMAPDFHHQNLSNSYCQNNGSFDPAASLGSYENSVSFTPFGEAPDQSFDMQTNYHRQLWSFQDVDDELQSMAFGYAQHS